MGAGSSSSSGHFESIYKKEGDDALIKAVWDNVIKKDDYAKLSAKKFDFDCLAFEGGGVKGVAYAGAVKVLEDLGILKKIKRFAGTSAGAYMAMQLAIGMPVDEIFKSNGIPNLQDAYYDSGTWSLPMNLLKDYGWQSGEKLHNRIKDDLEKHLGDRDATMLDLYKKRGIELCVVVTNLNSRNAEYIHPKTMPTIKIADAVATSMSLPFLFAPTQIQEHNMMRFFIDGGLLENYPVRAYDGWYLSMKKEDDFFERIDSDPSTKFEGFNKKMLGMVVFSHGENQAHSDLFLARYGDTLLEGRPDTELSREREYTKEWSTQETKKSAENAARKLVQYVATEFKDKADENGNFAFKDFKVIMEAIEKNEEMNKHLEEVAGPTGLKPLKQSFEEMDIDGDQKLSLVEFLVHLTKKGVYLRYDLKSRHPRKINSIADYIMSITEVMQCYISELQEKQHDEDRTIGIYTDYVTTADFDLTLDDKAYMINLGYKACINYLTSLK